MNPSRIRRILASLILGLACAAAAAARSQDPLRFPVMAYTVQSRQVTFGNITHSILFRAYRHIPYVARPVSREFQSLDVDVPVEIDGHPVDARHAPIILNILVTGYRSVSVAHLQEHPDMPLSSIWQGMRRAPAYFPLGQDGPIRFYADGRYTCTERSQQAYRGNLALAAGYVVVTPGVRGIDNRDASGDYFGKAPAAIVDLKAAVRYIHHNAGRLPGNSNWVVAAGSGAAGGLSALLGSSGDSPLYATYLRALGAADASDSVFAVASYSPMTDLEHADMAYAWAYSRIEAEGGVQEFTTELSNAFADYENRLHLSGAAAFGPITSATLETYLLREYLRPAATKFLARLPAEKRSIYLAAHPWIHWAHHAANFSYADFVEHAIHAGTLPRFDDLDLQSRENALFGSATQRVSHFTPFSLAHTGSDPQPRALLHHQTTLMNPMYFLLGDHANPAQHWLLHTGTHDATTSPTIVANLAARLENLGSDVLAVFFWEGGHGAEYEPAGMVDWLYRLTGYPPHALNRL